VNDILSDQSAVISCYARLRFDHDNIAELYGLGHGFLVQGSGHNSTLIGRSYPLVPSVSTYSFGPYRSTAMEAA
jgi:hypothetical protein